MGAITGESEYAFKKPGCDWAEPNFFLDLLDRFFALQQGGDIQQAVADEIITDVNKVNSQFSGRVIWKNSGYFQHILPFAEYPNKCDGGLHTGLCITGDKAGFIVDHYNGLVIMIRPIAVHNYSFQKNIKESYFNRVPLETSVRDICKQLLRSKNIPELFVLLCEQLGYPIERDMFLKNIHEANLVYSWKSEMY